MLADVVPYLRCPSCRLGLAVVGPSLRCPAGHAFDVARQGYVALTAGPVRHGGDSVPMVEARAAFLAAGHYRFLSEALAEAAGTGTGGVVLDVGAGTGVHLAAVLDARPEAVGLALDVSKPALRRAAGAHPRAGAVLADAWREVPVVDQGVDVLLNVFAPRNGREFARVLAPDGVLVVATPTEGHLAELVGALGLLRVDPDKRERVAAGLGPGFAAEAETVLRETLRLTRVEVLTLVRMGPSARHIDDRELEHRLVGIREPITVSAQVRVGRYRPRP